MPFLKILLIDDDEINNYLNRRLIQKLNFAEEIIIKLNGKEAIDYLRSLDPAKYPDIILLDINMPVMDGYEFLNLFSFLPKKEKIFLAVLSSTNNSSDLSAVRSFDLELITKPLTSKKLDYLKSKEAERSK